MRLPRILLCVGLCLAACISYLGAGPVPLDKPTAYPDWWFAQDVIPRRPTSANVGSPRWPTDYPALDDFAAANMGQLKHVVTKAALAMRAKFGADLDPALTGRIDAWALGPAEGAVWDDFAAANIGQAKFLARPFYDELYLLGYSGAPLQGGARYPWTGSGPDDYALINLGQLKYLFSFSPASPGPTSTADVDQDSLPDFWEWSRFGGLAESKSDDFDGDGVSNYIEFILGSDPNDWTDRPAYDFRVIAEGTANDITTFKTLRSALVKAAGHAGVSVISVAPGHYKGQANTDLTDLPFTNVLIISEKGPLATVFDGPSSVLSGFVLGQNANLAGLTIQGFSKGLTIQGGNALVSNCIIRKCPDRGDGAVRTLNSQDFVIQDSQIQDNLVRAVYARGSSGKIRRTILRRNQAPAEGAAVMMDGSASLRIESSLLASNIAVAAGGAIFVRGAANALTVDGCTVIDNNGRSGSRAVATGYTAGNSTIQVVNSVLWNPQAADELPGPRAEISATFSIIRKGYAGQGNLNLEPLLDSNGFPQTGSPAIDRGTAIPTALRDLYGQTRPAGSRVDIGAVEFHGESMLPLWWQMNYFGHDGVLPAADEDGDGLSNYQEFVTGTDPLDTLNGAIPAISILSGNGQQGATGAVLAEPLVVAVSGPTGVWAQKVDVTLTSADRYTRFSATLPVASDATEMTLSTGSAGTATVYFKHSTQAP